MRYVALLRGINVGGNNLIKMADLATAFVEMGFGEVKTYIQSGNVIFSAEEKDKQILVNKIEKELSKRFAYKSVVVVVAHKELRKIVEEAPKGFGKEPGKYHSDAAFLIGVESKDVIGEFELHPEVDMVWAGKAVVYYRRLSAKLTKSRLSKIVGKPVYKEMTIRSWNTVSKLLALMDAKEVGG